MVLPAPVEPMIAVVSPGLTHRLMPASTGCSAPGYLNSTSRSSTRPCACTVRIGSTGATTEESVSSTSAMRRALTIGTRRDHQHHRRHHHAHQDGHQVLDEGQ